VLRPSAPRHALELAVLLAGYLALTWGLLPSFRSPAALAAILLAVLAGGAWVTYLSPVVLHGDSPGDRGLGPRRTLWIRTDNLAPAAVRFASLAGAATLLLVAVGLARYPERLAALTPRRFLLELARYFPLALVQDLALVFVLVRLGALFATAGGKRPGVAPAVAAAALFALVHAPNAAMMVLAGLFVLGAGPAFLSRPNLAALVLCHAWSGAVLRSATGLCTRIGPFTATHDVWVTRELVRTLWGQVLIF
jgi:hypothetical protein